MSHYDDAYADEDKKDRVRAKKLASTQLKLMKEFIAKLSRGCGDGGISKRHLDHFNDMMNETELRTAEAIKEEEIDLEISG